MRTIDPQSAKDFWLARFLRVVLTRKPSLRFGLDYNRIDHLYSSCPDPVQAACFYLQE